MEEVLAGTKCLLTTRLGNQQPGRGDTCLLPSQGTPDGKLHFSCFPEDFGTSLQPQHVSRSLWLLPVPSQSTESPVFPPKEVPSWCQTTSMKCSPPWKSRENSVRYVGNYVLGLWRRFVSSRILLSSLRNTSESAKWGDELHELPPILPTPNLFRSRGMVRDRGGNIWK